MVSSTGARVRTVRTYPGSCTPSIIGKNHGFAMNDLAEAIRHFGEQELAVRRLYASEPAFRDLCEDLAIAVDSLERWKKDSARAAEYEFLIWEIETEISEFMEKNAQPR
jgi:hypothetical protein